MKMVKTALSHTTDKATKFCGVIDITATVGHYWLALRLSAQVTGASVRKKKKTSQEKVKDVVPPRKQSYIM